MPYSSSRTPPERARDGETQERPGRRLGPILGVAKTESGDPRAGRWTIEDGDLTDQLDPAELGPVVVVAVHGQRGVRTLAKPTDSRRLAPRSLGLVVDHRPGGALAHRIRHRQHTRAAGGVDQAEVADPLVLEEATRPRGKLL